MALRVVKGLTLSTLLMSTKLDCQKLKCCLSEYKNRFERPERFEYQKAKNQENRRKKKVYTAVTLAYVIFVEVDVRTVGRVWPSLALMPDKT